MNISDDELFKDPPPKVDCEICLLPMPYTNGICGVGKTYMPCCGKSLCSGCMIAAKDEMIKGNMKDWCPFCRMPFPRTSYEFMKRWKNRMESMDAGAFLFLGRAYRDGGGFGLTTIKSQGSWAVETGAELGSCKAHNKLSLMYMIGEGVEQDMEKSIHHLKIAAIGGHERARTILAKEGMNGNMDRAMKHFIIAAKRGFGDSLKEVGDGYKAGHVTKDEYAATLRYQVSVNETKSEERTKALSL